MNSVPLQKKPAGSGAGLADRRAVSGTQPRLPPEGEQRMVPIDQLKASRGNPRRDFREEDLVELAESIRQKGLVQPIIVRPDPATGRLRDRRR